MKIGKMTHNTPKTVGPGAKPTGNMNIPSKKTNTYKDF